MPQGEAAEWWEMRTEHHDSARLLGLPPDLFLKTSCSPHWPISAASSSVKRRRIIDALAPSTTVIPLQTVRGACGHDCPDTCAWIVEVRDGVAERLSGDPAHPFTRGTLCAKVNHYLDRVYHPDRVLYPLKRAGRKGDEIGRASCRERG